MPKRDQLRRLMEIDRRIRAEEYPNADSLSNELEVKRRVLFNDRAYLINVLGAPLAFSRRHGGWYYTEPTWTLPNLMVTRGELLAFVLAVEAARHSLGPLLQEELHTAVEKIGGSLEGSIAIDWLSLSRHFTFALSGPTPAPPSVAANLLLLHEAIQKRRVVRMHYFSARRNQTTWRRVMPHHIHNYGGEWRFFAFDPALQEMRTFNVARIETLQLLDEKFAPQENFDPQTFLVHSFRHELGPQVHEIAVRFDENQAPYIRERQWHASQAIEELPNGGLILRFAASGLDEIARWVLSYGAHAEVLEPLVLRQSVAEIACALNEIYQP